MISSDIPWTLWRSYLAVMRTGSLSNAARELAVSQPTVGRHVDELEAMLGQRLFTRSQTGLAATQLAHTLREPAQAMEDAAYALVRAASQDLEHRPRTVRIAASQMVGIEILPPLISQILSEFPNLSIELALSDDQEDLLNRAADIAVRMTRPKQDRLLQARAGSALIGLFAHRNYLARRGTPCSVRDLTTHALIGADRMLARIQGVALGGLSLAEVKFAFRCDNDVAQLNALRSAVGIGIAQRVIAAREPNLVPVIEREFELELEVWVVMHEDLKDDPILKSIFRQLRQGLLDSYGAPSKGVAG